MKQCPQCRTEYADDSMSFCLNDGANLIFAPEPAATVRMSFDKNPVRVNIAATDSVPTFQTPPLAPLPTQPPKKGFGLIVAGVCGLLLLLIIGGLAAFTLLRPADNKNSAVTVPTPTVTPTAAPTAAPNEETAKLREEMANLQKQLQDQKNQKKTTPAETFAPPKEASGTARANSPRDGFLALRDAPDSQTGARIAKIPHGAAITVLGCPKAQVIGRKAGRWCQVIYEGQSGWAFDAFITF